MVKLTAQQKKLQDVENVKERNTTCYWTKPYVIAQVTAKFISFL